MDFIYHADSKKVVDGDVKLNTEEDLEREIDRTETELGLLLDALDLLGEGEEAIGAVKAIKKDLRKFKKILQSLLDLKKDRFGSDSTPEDKRKMDKKIALVKTELSNLKKNILFNLKKKRRLDLLFEVTLKE